MANGQQIVVVGGGPAGLTAAYLLCKKGFAPLVLEADPAHVGGISRTVSYKGYCFDIGGHRFFTKSREVDALWSELLPDDMLLRDRTSRIYYKRRFFDYPIKPVNALLNLGVAEAARCMLSYARAKAMPVRAPGNFEEWTVNQFGRRLFEIFFKTYTEKVWGIPCTEISSDWAAQRIKGLSLTSAVASALGLRRRGKGAVITTLIERFRYPRKGPGMLWEECAARIGRMGGEVRRGRTVTGLRLDGGAWHVRHRGPDGAEETARADQVVCSAALRDVVRGLDPAPPAAVREAAERLRYREFVVVALVVRERGVFDDTWIYIQDPDVKVGRVQNFKAWSPGMVPDPATNCYGLEYFCFEEDALWRAPDAQLAALARDELGRLGLGRPEDVLDAAVVRQAKAYPVYDRDYAANIGTVRAAVEQGYPGLHMIGRNGMHRYNNQDHSMMTAMLTVENIAAGRRVFDPWRVNQDAEYHEEEREGAGEGAAPAPA